MPVIALFDWTTAAKRIAAIQNEKGEVNSSLAAMRQLVAERQAALGVAQDEAAGWVSSCDQLAQVVAANQV